MNRERLKALIECLIFASERPISIRRLADILEIATRKQVEEAVASIMEDYRIDHRGIEVVEVAGGYQFRTRAEYSQWVARLKGERFKMSRPALETLAIIAYKQPITRADIEDIRGVDVTGVLHLLLSQGLIKILGRKKAPGHPFLYGTTPKFLETFGLKDLSHLPTPKEWQELKG